MMFINVSPSEFDAEETACSLMFATRVRRVELGPAAKNTSRSPTPLSHDKSE